MKTSVKNLMMSLALMGCLIIGASDASAQGRSRSQGGSTNRSQSAAVSRSSNTSATPQVNRSSNTASSRSSTSAAPQVSRSTTTRSTSATPQVSRSTTTTPSTRSTTVAPQSGSRSTTSNRGTVGRSTGSTSNRPSTVTTPASTTRTTTGSRDHSTSGKTQGKAGDITSRDHKSVTTNSVGRTTLNNKSNANVPDNRPDVTPDKGDKNRRNGAGGRNGGNVGNDRGGNKDHNGGNVGNVGNDRGGNKDRNGNRPENGGNRDRNGHRGDNGNRSYSPNNHYDYSNHHYRDQFSWNYSHHSWSRPLPPPARPYRPAPLVWHRPVIPAGWHPYASAPVIDRILGLMFGTLYEASLDHLYYSGYNIDGYADGIIYLRDVPLMDLYWPDVMLNYEYNKLVNAQFVYHSNYYNRSRFDRVYRSLCRVYGSPVFQDGMTISWYGGNNTGWVTLTMDETYGDYYTTLSIGY